MESISLYRNTWFPLDGKQIENSSNLNPSALLYEDIAVQSAQQNILSDPFE